MGSALDIIEQALIAKARDARKVRRFLVPSLWISDEGAPTTVEVDPFEFYLAVVRRARVEQPGPRAGGDWSRQAIIYNMFVRTSAAFDHDGNGKLDLPCNSDGFRETGTFLKAIAMLPYIRRLGATAIHLLPITAIGRDGNKGSLGSPYAIRDPYALDENLAEPVLGLDAKTELQAFVEAAHAFGFKVVVEFVFRTAARDAEWIKEHPEWFYWIKDDIPTRKRGEADARAYGSPLFTADELHRIHDDVNHKRTGDLPQPSAQFKGFFVEPPPPADVVMESGRYVGTVDGTRAKIPGAFADWPPDDNQSPWDDVTYLRMYTNREFNYVSYNTIRIYDARLAQPRFVNRPLWDRITAIIPYYQREFAIDGVMIDMGYALPMDLKIEMIRRAREIDPDFAFWDEHFDMIQQSRDEGYDAVIGYVWCVLHVPHELSDLCTRLDRETIPVPYFATAETHNSHRAAARPGGTRFSRWTLVFTAFLPAIPFIHSGFELGEVHPINTGIEFSDEEHRLAPPETLPLFSEYAYDWTRATELTAFVAQVMALRARYQDLVIDRDHRAFHRLETGDGSVIAYARVHAAKRLAIVINTDCEHTRSMTLRLDTKSHAVTDLLSTRSLQVDGGGVAANLEPGEALVFEY